MLQSQSSFKHFATTALAVASFQKVLKKKRKEGADDPTTAAEELMKHSKDALACALTKNASESEAAKLFSMILEFMGDKTTKYSDKKNVVDILKKIAKHPNLRDEFYCQILKQLNDNPDKSSLAKGWVLFNLCASFFGPTDAVSDYITSFVESKAEMEVHNATERAIFKSARNILIHFRTTMPNGPRKHLPTPTEVESSLNGELLSIGVFLLDGTSQECPVCSSTSILDLRSRFAKALSLQKPTEFGLYELNIERGTSRLLMDDEYVLDVVARWVEGGSRDPLKEKDAETPFQLLFKKRLTFKADSQAEDSNTRAIHYLQCTYDYIQGNFVCTEDEAVWLASLQVQALNGDVLPDAKTLREQSELLIPDHIFATRKRSEWAQLITKVHQKTKGMSPDAAKHELLDHLKQSICFGSTFFHLKRIEDQARILPSKTVLGINEAGLHFFKPTPREYILTIELKSITRFQAFSHSFEITTNMVGVSTKLAFDARGQEQEICGLIRDYSIELAKRAADAKFGFSHGDAASERASPSSSTASTRVQKAVTSEASFAGAGEEEEETIAEIDEDEEDEEEEEEDDRSQADSVKESARGSPKDEREGDDKEIPDAATGKGEMSRGKSAIEVVKEQKRQRAASKSAASAAVQEELERGQKEIESLKKRLNEESEKFDQIQRENLTISAELKRAKAEIEHLRASLKEGADKAPEVREVEVEVVREVEKKVEYRGTPMLSSALKDLLVERDGTLEKVSVSLKKMSEKYNKAKEAYSGLKKEKADLAMRSMKSSEEIEKYKQEAEQVKKEAAEFKNLLDAQSKRLGELEEGYKKESMLRKKYYNEIQDMKGAIRVYCRCRPVLPHEEKRGDKDVTAFPDGYTVKLTKKTGEMKEFIYDSCFGSNSTQDDVWNETRPLIQSAADGYNVCIFAYGQTGAGKTHTMYGSAAQPGLTPRVMDEIFRVSKRDAHKMTYHISCTLVELYRDDLVDLLADKKATTKLEVKKDAKGFVYVQGAVVKKCSNATELQDYLEEGTARRHVASTKMNADSSRSHLIFTILLEVTNNQTQKTTNGKITLADLAGSERVNKSGASGDQLKEAQSINKSLTALGDVIESLSQNKGHVPYRNHKLTMLMSDTLGGSAKALMFVNISPADYNYDESVNSLTYASRVKLITNNAKKSEDNRETKRLKEKIAQLQQGIVDETTTQME